MLRSLRPAAALALLCASAPVSVHAFTLELAEIHSTGDQFYGCGMEINGSDGLVPVGSSPPGLGVSGGPSDLFIDGNESVSFEFLDGPATFVRYTVADIVASGGATIEAYDAALDLIGSVEVSGTGTKDVSALFGGVPLSSFRVVNSVGGHRIGSVSFEPAGGAVTVELREAPDLQTESLKYCGVGFAVDDFEILYVSPAGLGVATDAGTLDFFFEPGEALTVELDDPARGLSYTQTTNGPTVPRVRLSGFGALGPVIGEVETEGAGPVDVTALFGGASLTGFHLEVLEGELALDELVIVPEPAAASLAALAALAGLRARRSVARGRAPVGAVDTV